MVKRIISLILVCLLSFCLISCSKTYYGIDELAEKARKEIPISDTTDINYAGMCIISDKALIWFISGNENQEHYYLPMEVYVKGDNEYTFVRTYKPMDDRCEDIAAICWNGGYNFVINNPKCASVKITDADGTHEEKINIGTPYVFHNMEIPTEYVFLDADGNELR